MPESAKRFLLPRLRLQEGGLVLVILVLFRAEWES